MKHGIRTSFSCAQLQVAVQTLFVELENHSLDAFGELISYIALLSAQSFLNTRVSLAVPVVETVNLVQGNDEGTSSLLQEVQRLNLTKVDSTRNISNNSATIDPTVAEKDSQGWNMVAQAAHQDANEAKKQFVVPSPSLERSGPRRPSNTGFMIRRSRESNTFCPFSVRVIEQD